LGDKGGKKDRDKSKKQATVKQERRAQDADNKQPKKAGKA
jgi:hypothetical protein